MPPSDEVLIAAITTFGIIITGLLGYLGVVATGARRHAKAARHQVQNSHNTNLRDDLDEKFDGLADLVKGAVKDIGGVRADVRLVRHEAAIDREQTLTALAVERERIGRLERRKATAVAKVATDLEATQMKENE